MKSETAKRHGLLRPILAPYPWHTVTMDFVGKFEAGRLSGNTYCLVIIDKFSKYTLLQSVPEACDSRLLVDIFLQRVVAEFGVPIQIISDRGP